MIPLDTRLDMVYVNWEGKRATRRVHTLSRRWGHTEQHPDDQWLIEVFDLDKQLPRTFAEQGIESWCASAEDLYAGAAGKEEE